MAMLPNILLLLCICLFQEVASIEHSQYWQNFAIGMEGYCGWQVDYFYGWMGMYSLISMTWSLKWWAFWIYLSTSIKWVQSVLFCTIRWTSLMASLYSIAPSTTAFGSSLVSDIVWIDVNLVFYITSVRYDMLL